jgi:ribonuclease HII
MRIKPSFAREEMLLGEGFTRVAGLDEAGRGPLAGPVVAAAVVLNPLCVPPGLGDSKQLSALQRERAATALHETSEFGLGQASVEEIEQFNILGATHLAMRRALADLRVPADVALIDGNSAPRHLSIPAQRIVRGDALCLSIAAASILAKVWRDQLMVALAQQHPGYGWETNKGYGSKSHMMALQRLGPTPWHRRSFAPLRYML